MENRYGKDFSLTLLLGERRRLTTRVTIGGAAEFVLRDASYELTDEGGRTVESGAAEIHAHDIVLYLEPAHAGYYRLTITFSVGGEVVKRRLAIMVEE